MLATFLFAILSSCSVSKQLSAQADRDFGASSVIGSAHIGISVFEPATGKYWFNRNAEKYFVPASNTKLFSLYAGMKYLPDSLPAACYSYLRDTLFFTPLGDPSFLAVDFVNQPLFRLLKNTPGPIAVIPPDFRENPLGAGWSWDDYNDDYEAERSAFPIYGNVIKWINSGTKIKVNGDSIVNVYSSPGLPPGMSKTPLEGTGFLVKRNLTQNEFSVSPGTPVKNEQDVPFVTNGLTSALDLLADTLGKKIVQVAPRPGFGNILFSQPSDSLYKIMMHRSDNFFAEQVLLMAGNSLLTFMNDQEMIDTLLNGALKDLPQKPSWVDGSGLSRYNLFSPNDMVFILNKMKTDFGFERIKNILPTGGTGTLRSYYLQDSGFIYAKTGSLSNVSAISGFVITRKKKVLVFSILANNFVSSPTMMRKAFEKFITGIRHRY